MEGEMAERTPDVEINVESSEFPDSLLIEIEILGGDEAVRHSVKMDLLKAVAAVTDQWVIQP
jgi:hypothetical protein